MTYYLTSNYLQLFEMLISTNIIKLLINLIYLSLELPFKIENDFDKQFAYQLDTYIYIYIYIYIYTFAPKYLYI